ncbi:FAD synthase-like [Belonocnema kinseyi]|uniref:FAD synthase-like n=1 Tax=Belonocnema kinseyi TaxID=2817044 RepID=UPI00143DC781|nr:FAD synthase-like [Belonocnema kinseyi]
MQPLSTSGIIFGTNSKNYLKIIRQIRSTFPRNQTAGIIIIGDEILKAQVKDTNSQFICNLLYKCGVRVKKISVISDNVDEVANEIREFSGKYTHVITSGGIGPTHDDVTYEGLGKAFGSPLHYHPKLVDIVKNKFGVESASSPGFKLAYIPKEASLHFGKNEETGRPLTYPCVTLKNVFVFPGSPNFLKGSFGSLCEKLFRTSKHFFSTQLYLNAREEVFANALTSVSKEFPDVTFGSYPDFSHSYYKARVTIESDNELEAQKARDKFCSLIPNNILVDYDQSPLENVVQKFERFVEKQKERRIYEDCLNKIESIYQAADKVAIYFDSNAESIVLTHLAFIASKRIQRNSSKIELLYCPQGKISSAEEKFLKQIVETYAVSLVFLKESPQEAIQNLPLTRPDLNIILFGAKSEEEKKEVFKESEELPRDIKMESPLMGWTSTNVWTFLTSLSLSYCSASDKR